MEFGILGPTELIHGGKAIPLGPAKQRGMLAVLLYRAGEPVRADAIIRLLWGPHENADHRPTLYSLASRLRAVLAQVGMEKALVRIAGFGAYRLDIDPDAVDFHRFRRLLADAHEADRQRDPETAAELLVRAMTLRRGDPLIELRGPQADELRTSVNETLLEAHRLLAVSWSACGRHHAVLAQLERVIHDHDLDEALARCWARALLGVGRADEAKRFVIAFRRRFRKEMRADPDLDLAAVVARPAAAVVPQHLPPDIADFTGRQAVLAELDEMRGPDRPPSNVVVITGMPGVGKTTLAVHWAHRQRGNFPDGQLHLDAGAYGPASPIDPNDALDRFLRALGVPADQVPVSLEQRRDRFADLIGDRRILILVDNVLGSDQVRPLIPRSMNCLTIITSRNRLSGLTIRDGVRTVTVGPLSEVESAALLARILGPEDEHDAGGLAALARLSSGLPLAVRIIGERVAERPRTGRGELADDLVDHLLDATDDDDQPVSLNTVFAWSYRALREDAARLFRRISIHPGRTFSSDAAAAVLGVPPAVAESLLNSLARAHLVNHDTARRYRFHDLLRRYATDLAAAEDDPGSRRRLLDWYLLSAANAAAVIAPEWPPMPDLPDAAEIGAKTFPTESEAMKWCDAERDNFGPISRWADNHGYHRHGWQIPGVVHEILERYGCQGDILRLTQQALASARRDGHEPGQIGTLINLGATHFAMHDYGRAVENLLEAKRLAAATGHLDEETICSHNLASTYLRLGDPVRAIEIYEEVLLVCRKTANPAGESAVLHWLGEAYLRLGQHQRSAEAHLQSLAIRERIGAKRGMGQSHAGLGKLYLACGRLRRALWHCETALAIHVRAHDQRAECDTLVTMAEVQQRIDERADAVRGAERAVCLADQINDSFRRVRSLTVLASALVAVGDPASARHRIRAARRTLDDLSGVHVHELREHLRIVERAVHHESRAG